MSVSRGTRALAVIDYKTQDLIANNQWELKDEWVFNKPMTANPDIRKSRALNFDMGMAQRIDLRFEETPFASLLFNDRDLYSVQFNGEESLQHFDQFVQQEVNQRPLNYGRVQEFLNSHPDTKVEVIQEFVIDWLRSERANNEGANHEAVDTIYPRLFQDNLKIFYLSTTLIGIYSVICSLTKNCVFTKSAPCFT